MLSRNSLGVFPAALALSSIFLSLIHIYKVDVGGPILVVVVIPVVHKAQGGGVVEQSVHPDVYHLSLIHILMDCRECKERFRADKLIEDWCQQASVELPKPIDAFTQQEMKDFKIGRAHV